jgi:hypothetical protein
MKKLLCLSLLVGLSMWSGFSSAESRYIEPEYIEPTFAEEENPEMSQDYGQMGEGEEETTEDVIGMPGDED